MKPIVYTSTIFNMLGDFNKLDMKYNSGIGEQNMSIEQYLFEKEIVHYKRV